MSPPSSQRRGRHVLRAVAFSILVLGLAGVSACGEDRSNLLPGDTVAEITENLDRVRDLAGSGDCSGALDAAHEVSLQIEGLGTAVDARLRRSLRQGATRLVLTIQTECQEGGEDEADDVPADQNPEPSDSAGTGPDETTSPDPGDTGDTGNRPDRTPQPDPGDNTTGGGNTGGGNTGGGNTGGGGTGGGNTGGGNGGGDQGTGGIEIPGG